MDKDTIEQNTKISVNWTKDEVYSFLKEKISDEDLLKKLKDEEIDGDALILLIKNGYKFPNLKLNVKKTLLKYIETDIFIPKKNIEQNELFEEIYKEEIDKLWKKNKSKELKIGDKLKYIKYLIIRDPPPDIEKNNELEQYLNKIIENKNNISEIQKKFKDLLEYEESDLNEQFEEWELNDDDIFKLKIIIKFKQNSYKSQQKKEINTDNNKEINNKNKINIINNQNYDDENNNIENKKSELNSSNRNESITQIINEKNDNYKFYYVVEVFTYDTSQREITYGFRNPIEDFKKICSDFNIKYENDCSFIDYNDAEKIKFSSFMLWGSKEGLKKFLQENNIDLFIKYMEENDYLEKAGIYFCLNIDKKIGYFIIWPGNFSYHYNKITEPNDNILLTLIRYGFYISSNSILCFTKEELEKFDENGYEIFQDNKNDVLKSEVCKIQIDRNNEKSFELSRENSLKEGLNDVFKKKIILLIQKLIKIVFSFMFIKMTI
jgi:hypothetical protein